MPKPKQSTAKPGDKCPYCNESTLGVSPSGKHLMCPKCGRMVILAGPGQE